MLLIIFYYINDEQKRFIYFSLIAKNLKYSLLRVFLDYNIRLRTNRYEISTDIFNICMYVRRKKHILKTSKISLCHSCSHRVEYIFMTIVITKSLYVRRTNDGWTDVCIPEHVPSRNEIRVELSIPHPFVFTVEGKLGLVAIWERNFPRMN